MKALQGKNLTLRAMEPNDIDIMYKWENDPDIWKYSNTVSPFSRFHLEQYVINSHCDIYTDKQLRLMITDQEKNTVGCVDLFEFDPKNRRAGIGILIAGEHRKKGYASETLEIIIHYARSILNLKQLYCNISENNKISINLFKKKGFVKTGTKNDWRLIDNEWENEHFFQLIFAPVTIF